MKVAVLGPGGVGGLIAGALDRAGHEVVIVARRSTAELISARGVQIQSVTLGDFVARPRAVEHLREPVAALIVSTKALGLEAALERIEVRPPLVLPLLNGLDHLSLLRKRFAPQSVLAGAIRVEADRPQAGAVVHTSPFLLVQMAGPLELAEPIAQLGAALEQAGVSTRVLDSQAQVMWSKLVRLNALACTTSAHDKLLGEIRSTPELRADLVGVIEESCAVAQAEGAPGVNAEKAVRELEQAHATLGSSMQRDIAAGREPELDAIPGSVLRAGARHGIECPTIERLVRMIAARIGAEPPIPARPR